MRLHQTKNLSYNEGNYQQNERQPTEWEKIFANNISVKRLISKIYEERIQHNIKKTTTQLKIGQRTQIDIFPKKTYR